jgi:hypothetical protein
MVGPLFTMLKRTYCAHFHFSSGYLLVDPVTVWSYKSGRDDLLGKSFQDHFLLLCMASQIFQHSVLKYVKA